MSAPGPGGRGSGRRRSGSVWTTAAGVAALVLGLPVTIGLAIGAAPRDWPIPLAPQTWGDFALRTCIYLSGLATFWGAIRLARTAMSGEAGPADTVTPSGLVPPAVRREPRARNDPSEAREDAGRGDDRAAPEQMRANAAPSVDAPTGGTAGDHGHVSVVEPLYGFLPGPVQERLAREAGYQALLYTKISILLSAAVGVLLAGSWEPVSAFEPAPPEAAARVLAGLFLIAESIDRYLFFAKGRPTGSLIGSLLYGALAPLGRLGRG